MKSIRNLFIIGLVVVVLFYFGIAAMVTKIFQDKGDGNFVQGVGEYTKELKEDFNKGYENDSVTFNTDSIK